MSAWTFQADAVHDEYGGLLSDAEGPRYAIVPLRGPRAPGEVLAELLASPDVAEEHLGDGELADGVSSAPTSTDVPDAGAELVGSSSGDCGRCDAEAVPVARCLGQCGRLVCRQCCTELPAVCWSCTADLTDDEIADRKAADAGAEVRP